MMNLLLGGTSRCLKCDREPQMHMMEKQSTDNPAGSIWFTISCRALKAEKKFLVFSYCISIEKTSHPINFSKCHIGNHVKKIHRNHFNQWLPSTAMKQEAKQKQNDSTLYNCRVPFCKSIVYIQKESLNLYFISKKLDE